MENKRDDLENSSGNKKSSLREVDILTQDVRLWWGDTFVFIKKTRVKTWLGVFIIAFIAGAVTAIIWTVSKNIQTISKADGETATLSLSADSNIVAKDDAFNLTVSLNTHSSNVVVVKAVINYNKDDFQLANIDTINGDFEVERCLEVPTVLCAIVDDDSINGKLTITVPNPSPGVNSSSATVATLTFLALREVTPSSPNITLSYIEGSYDDSDVILDDQEGTDILNSVNNISITVAPIICTSWTYSEWGVCMPGGIKERTILSYAPEGCLGGNPEELEQECEYVPPVCTSFEYSEWGACQVNDIQSRTITVANPNGCVGGVEPQLTQSCDYPHPAEPPTCLDFQYSEWSACQIDNTQSRTATASPEGCTGGSPILNQECTYAIANNLGNNNTSDDNEHRSKPKKEVKPKRYISNSPENVKRGGIITERGKNFSKNKKVSLYFSKPGGGYYPPKIMKTDSKGGFWITYKIPLYRPVGKYTWYAVDLATGKKSKTIDHTVK